MTTTAAGLASRLEAIVGGAHVAAEPAACRPYSAARVAPAAVVRPADALEAAAIVRVALEERLAVLPCGARTKLDMGMPPGRFDIAMDMTRLDRVAHYDAGDLTLSVDAGMPLAKLNAVLLERNQFLPLLVPYYSLSTIGGTMASGLDSTLRQFYGTARDFSIGAEFIDGTGSLCRSGGRVVKNVTGYDLHKLLIGSLGTLGVITRLNFRTFPRPVDARGFVASFAAMEPALALQRKIAGSPLSLLTLDVVSPALARIFAERSPSSPEVAVFGSEDPAALRLPPLGAWFHPDRWQLAAAFAGTPEVLERAGRDLGRYAAESGALSQSVLDDRERPSLWGRLREALAMLRESSEEAVVFKLSADPHGQPALLGELEQIALPAGIPCASLPRALGPVYFALVPGGPEDFPRLAAAASAVVQCAVRRGVPVTMLFAPPALQEQLGVWPGLDHELHERVKRAFDPQSIFAPGRFRGGVS